MPAIPLPLLKSLGARLRHVRRARHMTQEALAAPQFSKRYVRAVEHSKVQPSRLALEFLAQRLAVPVTYLLDGAVPADLLPDLFALGEDLAYQIDRARWEIDQSRPTDALPLLAAAEQAYAFCWQDISPAIRYRLHYARAAAYIRLAQPEPARAELARAQPLTMFMPEGAEATERVRNALGATYYQQAQVGRALALHSECLQAINSGIVKDWNLQLLIYTNVANDHLALNEPAAAIEAYKDSLHLLEDVSNRERRAATCWGLSMAYKAQNDWRWARVYAVQALDLYAAAGNWVDHALMQINLAELHLQRREYDAAADLLAAAQRFFSGPAGNSVYLSRAYEHLAALALGRGDLALGASYAKQSVYLSATAWADNAAGAAHTGRTYTRALCIAGQVAGRQGQFTQAQAYFVQAETIVANSDLGELLHEIRVQHAELLTTWGAHAAATPYYQAATAPLCRPAAEMRYMPSLASY